MEINQKTKNPKKHHKRKNRKNHQRNFKFRRKKQIQRQSVDHFHSF